MTGDSGRQFDSPWSKFNHDDFRCHKEHIPAMDSIQLYAVRMIDLEHDTSGRVELHHVVVLRRPQSARVIREYSTTDAQYTRIR